MEFWMVIPIAVFGFIYIAEKLTKIEKKNDARLKRIEDRLQLITKEMGIVEGEPEINKAEINKAEINKAEINKELRQLVEAGKKVKAIKRVREAFGFSLLEAKQYVDKL
ncbi:TPA: hypothetical protein QCX47_004387 [Bacillus mycoides]|nr:hypothetical protein [Bacillus mycoides]